MMNAFHPVGVMVFPDDGPSHVEVDCEYSDVGLTAGQWMVGIEITPVEDGIDKTDPSRWDAENGNIIPESCFAISPSQALELASLLTQAAEQATLFQAADPDA